MAVEIHSYNYQSATNPNKLDRNKQARQTGTSGNIKEGVVRTVAFGEPGVDRTLEQRRRYRLLLVLRFVRQWHACHRNAGYINLGLTNTNKNDNTNDNSSSNKKESQSQV